ncbi:hypothetical protein QLQ15_12955 [Lysobacter sp. LF1]|uniref:Uncharacterized protein n=1 Tax=Lysobacter stagni TaxID=3045172 RepID=A0ABT6XIB0_9GAMM|nr:hypothetical protein [Lysobacter sp. LF1]MDI9239813.1 hypothetical protein [Lysobacter sp. LF1]
MGTLHSLMDRLARRAQPEAPVVSVGAHGFSVGDAFVSWQSVSEIRAFKTDRITADEVLFHIEAAGRTVVVSETSPGFEALEAAMIAVFPSTSAWRAAVIQPPFQANPTVLYRRT